MKKIVMVLIILYSTILFSKSEAFMRMNKPYCEPPIKGGFRECTYYSYKYKFGKLQIKTKHKEKYSRYDELGNLIEEIDYNEDGSLLSRNIYKYDLNRNIIENTSYNNEDFWLNEIYIYNDKDSLIEDSYCSEDGKVLRTQKLNEKENRIEAFSYNENGKPKIIETTTLNKNGDLIEDIAYNDNDTIISKITIQYDEKGNDIGQFYKLSGIVHVNTTIHNVYDNNGNITKKTTYDKLHLDSTIIIFKYDDKNHMIEEFSNYDSIKTTYKYDEIGNIIERTEYNSKGKINYKEAYKFDNNGKKIESLIHSYDSQYVQHRKFIYDNNGNIIEFIQLRKNGSIDSKIIFNYDDFGNID